MHVGSCISPHSSVTLITAVRNLQIVIGGHKWSDTQSKNVRFGEGMKENCGPARSQKDNAS